MAAADRPGPDRRNWLAHQQTLVQETLQRFPGLASRYRRLVDAQIALRKRPDELSGDEADAERAIRQALLERATVLAVGPGFGRGPWGRALFRRLLEVDLPTVVDADGLNLLAEAPRGRADWVLTPHPGEAARLLGVDPADVQADRFAAADELAQRYGGVVVLKGAGTVIVGEADVPAVCTAGNPGMASGGMGDVLTGLIAGLLAQGMAPRRAAELGVCLHATAADRAAASGGERGLVASDLIARVRALVNDDG
jgi:NAD(P)H-hydrate epimerase